MMQPSFLKKFLTALGTAFFSAWLAFGLVSPAVAASPAETFVNDDIRAGLAILKNSALSPAERDSQFQNFLLSVTDLKRIALFTLGDYASKATPAQQDEFVQAFQNYAVAVYRSYFTLYSGQTLTVTGSQARSPDDVIVSTAMNSIAGGAPMQINFRVRTDGPKPVITDIGIAGMWLVLAERDDFAAFLNQHHGDVAALTAHLNDVARGYPQR